MKRFTREQVLEEVKKRYDGAVYMNALEDAMQEETFENAVDLVICESEYQANKAGGKKII
jgi:hypothetical protein